MSFPIRVTLTDDDKATMMNPKILDHAGGFATLTRVLRLRWIAAGCGDYLEIQDWATWERIGRYSRDYGSGGWQDLFQRFARQLPRDLPNPQSDLFGDKP